MKSSSFSSSSSTASLASPSMNSSGSFSSSHPDQTHSSVAGNEAQSSSFHGQAAAAGSGHEDGENESYERNFWANIFEEGSMVEHLLEGDEVMEEETKSSPSNGAHQTSLDGSEVDSTPSSALLDQWNHYDDSMDCSMAEFSAPQMTMVSSTSSGSMFSQSMTYQHLMAGPGDHEVHRANIKPGIAYNPHEQKLASGVASRSFAFEKQSDGTPFALSKPILRDDGIMLVGTEIIDEPARTARDKNRIFVTNIRSSNPGQMAANIVVESEVRDLHWMNSQTAIVAIGKDIHLISIGAGGGNRSCHLQPAIPSVHSDAIRELAVHATSSHVLSGGFDETVVLTDLRRGGDPTASSIVSKFDAHDVVSSLRWSPDESQLSWTTDGGDFQIADARTRSSQLQIPLYTFLQVESMGGLFTHEYLSAHKVVLGFEHNHLVYVDTRMPRNACCYAVLKSPMIKTGEIRRSKQNRFALFGLGGFANADFSRNAKNQEVLKLRQYHQATNSAYKTSGDFSFESNNILAVSDNVGTVTLYNSDSARAFDAGVHENWKEERTV